MQPPAPANPDWTLALPGRTVLVRAERPDDAGFLAALFRTVAAPLPGVDARMADALLDMQYRSQSAAYRSAYPGAWFAVMETGGERFGRLVLDRGAVAHIVDYALAPAFRGQGLGTAVLGEVLRRARGRVRSSVLQTNAASLAMFRRAGFVATGEDGPFIRMEWPPPA